MLIGKGVIANRFIDYSLQSKYLIYAGSVNDSQILDSVTIQNEEFAIAKALKELSNEIFVYFSSCSIQDTAVILTPYVKHKIRMEKLIQTTAKRFLIIRLPQILGPADDQSSLVNFLVNSIFNQKSFELWKNAYKNFIDIDDIHELVSEILNSNILLNQIINVASTHQTNVLKVVQLIEKVLGISAKFNLIEKGTNFYIDITPISPLLNKLKIDFSDNYIEKAIFKYFGHLKYPPKLLSIIVPTFNEEHGIEEFYRRTKAVLTRLSPRFNHEIIFVNDFSTDNTYPKLLQLAQLDSNIKLINFSRNFGNQISITAGIDYSQGDIAVIIDDDLQDPPEIILNLLSKWYKGYKVVYGIRPKRQGVKFLFRILAKLYYRIIANLSDTKIPNDTGDFRLIDRIVIETLKKMKEESRYYRGMVAWVGFPQIGVEYERDKRYAGVSTFTLKKYISFAFNGLTSFTERPLYFSSLAGLFITTISFILALILVISKIADPSFSIRGWTSMIVIILFFGGIQLMSIGILSIYISKIYREVKGRPLYIIESTKNIE